MRAGRVPSALVPAEMRSWTRSVPNENGTELSGTSGWPCGLTHGLVGRAGARGRDRRCFVAAAAGGTLFSDVHTWP